MKTEKNILIAFVLNLLFSVFEFIGGIYTGSVAVISDALHDIGDASGIGISYLLEKKSKRPPDEKYTYGYVRYSVMGGAVTCLILLFGSAAVIYNAVKRIMNPAEINYNGTIIFALFGVTINLAAAYFTKGKDSVNQKAVHLHMFEDVLGWAVVLAGAIIMRFTDISIIDPLMSIGVAIFITVNSVKNLKEIVDIFLEKTPHGISVSEIKEELMKIDGVHDVHHIHIRTADGNHHYATMHVATDSDTHEIKEKLRYRLNELGIAHATIETESSNEHCDEKTCTIKLTEIHTHHHH